MDGALSVTEFNQRISAIVTSSDNIRDVAIEGEISQISQSASGHFYLGLKDANSSINCTLFRGAAMRIPFKFEKGMKVVVFGSSSYYQKGGQLNFNIESMALAGKGEQQIALEKLTAQLLAEGLFDDERKRTIPRYPKVIGVVTSPKGAVIKDIIDTTARRYPVDILLSPATVQGEDAPKSIVNAIKLLEQQEIDVMIVGRGGGSNDDLSAFNDESVVRAIVECRVPVISAVGHATNKSLSDRAADKYAETPTGAAMLATPDRIEEARMIRTMWIRMDKALTAVSERMRARFDVLDHRLAPKNARAAVDVYQSRFRNASDRMDSLIDRKLMTLRNQFTTYDTKLDPKRLYERVNQNSMNLDDLTSRMVRAIKVITDGKERDLTAITMSMESLNPVNVLARGYSFVRDSQGNVVTSVKDLFPGTDVTIAMRDGSALAKIKELKMNERQGEHI